MRDPGNEVVAYEAESEPVLISANFSFPHETAEKNNSINFHRKYKFGSSNFSGKL